jgi:large subunit ribosomal protein L29
MKAKDLRDRSTEDLVELKNTLRRDLFSYRMKNHTGQLDDSSLINKTRKDIGRIEHILHERVLEAARAQAASSEATPAEAQGGSQS